MSPSESRSQRLRRRNRAIFGWSLAVAALIHVALFLVVPDIRTDLMDFASSRLVDGVQELEDVRWVDVRFGPPVIFLADGELRREPPERVLDVQRVDVGGLMTDRACEWTVFAEGETVAGSVRVRVGAGGRVQYQALEESFGNGCVDEVMVAVAEKLWYQWLPDDGAPPPVELVQPMWAVPSE